MCEPTSAILIGSAVAGTAIQLGSAVMNHNAQKNAADQNAIAAQAALKEDLKTLTVREGQEQQANASTILEIDRQARQTKAQAAVFAGESGVEGASVDALLDGFDNEAGRAVLGTQRNLKMAQAQLDRERAGARAGAQSRMNAVPGANPWATGLTIAGAGLAGAAQVAGALPRKASPATPPAKGKGKP